MTEHKRMVLKICKNLNVLENVLQKEKIYIRNTEHVIDNVTREKADIILQNKPITEYHKNTICYVVEIKSDQGDHELLGQIEKSVDAIKKTNLSCCFYSNVYGIAIAKEFTKTALELLNKHCYYSFEWVENESEFYLRNLSNFVRKDDFKRIPVVGTPHYTDVDMKIILETKFMSEDDK